MSGNFRTMVVVNPNSANGRTGREWSRIRTALDAALGEFDHRFTERMGHATELARQAIRDGCEMVVSLGGDGTNNEVVNGFFENENPVNPDAVFGVVSRGTGSDLIKTLKIPKEYEKSAPRLSGRKTAPCDVGRMTYLDHDGTTKVRYFINITSFGIGGAIDNRVNRTTKALGGKVSFFWGSFATLFSYRNQKVRMRIDDGPEEKMKILSVSVANGQYHGGGMWEAPRAKMDDGLFDVVILGDVSLLEKLTTMPGIYKGKHLDHPKTRYLTARRVLAESDEEVLLDVDGEQPGKLPADFEILPGAIRIKG